jgi:hypothetical protein
MSSPAPEAGSSASLLRSPPIAPGERRAAQGPPEDANSG